MRNSLFFAVYGHCGEIFYVFVHVDGLVAPLTAAYVVEEVVSAAACEVENMLGQFEILRVVDEAVESAVSADEDKTLAVGHFTKEGCVVGFGHVAEAALAADGFFSRRAFFIIPAIASVGVIEGYIFHFH